MHLSELSVDLDCIRHNAGLLKKTVSPATLCPVVKNNAYGHGLIPTAKALEAIGTTWLAVFEPGEGQALRKAGIKTEILVLSGWGNDLAAIAAQKLTPVLHASDQLDQLDNRANDAPPINVHIEIDTGMRRTGFAWDDVPTLISRINKCPHVVVEGVFSHFANADLGDADFNPEQVRRFSEAVSTLEQGLHSKPKWVHLSNSAATINLPETFHTMVRPGILTYGISPFSEPVPGYRPAMRWATKPISIRNVQAGDRVSYGGTWRASRDSIVATLPVGYGDGYPRILSNRASVLVRGQRAPQIGTICMNHTLVDVTDIPGCSTHDVVVLLGTQGNEEITAAELARHAETIPYEIVCGVAARVPRSYENA